MVDHFTKNEIGRPRLDFINTEEGAWSQTPAKVISKITFASQWPSLILNFFLGLICKYQSSHNKITILKIILLGKESSSPLLVNLWLYIIDSTKPLGFWIMLLRWELSIFSFDQRAFIVYSDVEKLHHVKDLPNTQENAQIR